MGMVDQIITEVLNTNVFVVCQTRGDEAVGKFGRVDKSRVLLKFQTRKWTYVFLSY